MLREHYQSEMKNVEKDIVLLVSSIINTMMNSLNTLKSINKNEAKKIIENDKNINKKRRTIEYNVINIIATQQPVATDLRELIAILTIVSELERIGDYIKGNAELILRLSGIFVSNSIKDIENAINYAEEMIEKSLNAFIAKDIDMAYEILKMDDNLDNITDKIYKDLINTMKIDCTSIETATYLLWVSHNIERIGDRVVNICEQVIYIINGYNKRNKKQNY